jgi:hypothetical protein
MRDRLSISRNPSVQAAVLDGFEEVVRQDGFLEIEVRDGAGCFEDAVIHSSTELQSFRGLFEKAQAGVVEMAVLFDVSGLHHGNGIDPVGSKPFELPLTGRDHTLANGGGSLRRRGAARVFVADGGDFDMQIDPTQNGAGNGAPVTTNLSCRANSSVERVTGVPAETGGHGCDQHESRGIRERNGCSRERCLPIFEGLSKQVQDVAAKLGEFIQKEHTVVGQCDLAGSRDLPTTHDAGIGNGMVR